MEVLIALVVIAFALYGILDLTASNQRLSLRAQQRAEAIQLARAKMAEVQAAGFDAVVGLWAKAAAQSPQSFVYPSQPGEFQPPYNAKLFRWQARFQRDPQRSDVINVEVVVTHRDQPPEGAISVGGLLVKK